MTDTWTWATVTQATPLRIKVDGDTSALDATTDNLVGSLAVDDRVRVHLHADGIIVTGIQGGGNRSNPNLLINSNFMVNQEGIASGATIAPGAYVLDGWKCTSSGSRVFSWADVGGVRTLTIGNASFTAEVGQTIEAVNLPAGVYAVSTDAVGASLNVYNAAGTVVASGVGTTKPAVSFTADGAQNYSVRLVTGAGTTATVSWVKVERSTVATPYQPPRYADNLRACMRYYQRFGGEDAYQALGSGFARPTGTARMFVPLPVSMRASPTLTYSTLALFNDAVLSVSALTVKGGENIIQVEATASGLTEFRPYSLVANGSTSAYIAFDARL